MSARSVQARPSPLSFEVLNKLPARELNALMHAKSNKMLAYGVLLAVVGVVAVLAIGIWGGVGDTGPFHVATFLTPFISLMPRAIYWRYELVTNSHRRTEQLLNLVETCPAARLLHQDILARGLEVYGFHLEQMLKLRRRARSTVGKARKPSIAQNWFVYMAYQFARVGLSSKADIARGRRRVYGTLALISLAMASLLALLWYSPESTAVLGALVPCLVIAASLSYQLQALSPYKEPKGAPSLAQMSRVDARLVRYRADLERERPLIRADYYWFLNSYQQARLYGLLPANA